MNNDRALYGFIAPFRSNAELLSAVDRVRTQGFRQIETFSPYPIDGLREHSGVSDRKIQLIVVAAAVLGAVGGYFLEYYAAVLSYPLNIGGRPFNSVPSFMQVSFEMLVLLSSLSAFVCVFWFGKLLVLHRPIFEAKDIELASRDGLFLFIRACDPHFDPQSSKLFLESLQPIDVSEVRA